MHLLCRLYSWTKSTTDCQWCELQLFLLCSQPPILFSASLVSYCFCIIGTLCPIKIESPGHFVLWSAKKMYNTDYHPQHWQHPQWGTDCRCKKQYLSVEMSELQGNPIKLKPGRGQAMHASPTARNFFLHKFLHCPSIHLHFFLNLSLDFFAIVMWLPAAQVPVWTNRIKQVTLLIIT